MKHLTYILLAAMLLASCNRKEETATEKIMKLKKERAGIDTKIRDLEAKSGMKDSIKAIPVSIAAVQPQSFQSYIDVQAAIAGDEDIFATPMTMGTVRRVLVHVGQQVGRGQTLAVLDAGPVDQQIAAQDAQLGLLRTLYQKQQTLWAQQIGTEVQLLSAKANYEAAVKQRAATMSQRDMYRITSPIAGTVDEVDIHEGNAALPGGPRGIRVVNARALKAKADLGEGYLGKVKVGDPVMLIFPDLNDSMRTHLTFVAQGVDPMSRAFGVEVALGAVRRLHPNMSARMKIANYESRDALVVPVASVQQTGEGPMVFLAVPGTGGAGRGIAKAVPVRTGRSSDGNVEILSGLTAGDKVVTAGFEELDNGTAIMVQ